MELSWRRSWQETPRIPRGTAQISHDERIFVLRGETGWVPGKPWEATEGCPRFSFYSPTSAQVLSGVVEGSQHTAPSFSYFYAWLPGRGERNLFPNIDVCHWYALVLPRGSRAAGPSPTIKLLYQYHADYSGRVEGDGSAARPTLRKLRKAHEKGGPGLKSFQIMAASLEPIPDGAQSSAPRADSKTSSPAQINDSALAPLLR